MCFFVFRYVPFVACLTFLLLLLSGNLTPVPDKPAGGVLSVKSTYS
jgi:hypothetical protein